MMKRFPGLAGLALAALLCHMGAALAADPYPSKPIRFILPVTAGGGVDAVARMVGQELSAALKQPVVIEHRPGAGGNVAAELVARSAPDGHTLLVATAAHAVNPSLYKSLSYDPVKDFTAVSKLSVQPYLFVVPNSVPAKNVREFIALAKTRKGGVTYASVGAGLLSHLGMELLKSVGDFDALHIAYKGAAPAFIDVLAGRVDGFLSTMTSGLPHVKSGKLRAIGVTSPKRAPQVPDVPTVAEQGFPGYEAISWYALMGPAGMPRTVVNTLNTELVRILKSEDLAARMSAAGADPEGSSPEELAAYVKVEIDRWAGVIKRAGITAE